MKRAIITIEVLIALIIMFSAIVLVTSSIRSLNLFVFKKEHYENSYVTVLSIKSLLENREFLSASGLFSGELNGYKYQVDYRAINKKKSYIIGETALLTGNVGNSWITLYDCTLVLSTFKSSNQYTFQITRYKRIKTLEQD
ncbi:MAG TPA: hypothetical protein EYG85_11920 [Crocinitomix sp.]|nr:hypothetical protein [Crocinitomix sp.]